MVLKIERPSNMPLDGDDGTLQNNDNDTEEQQQQQPAVKKQKLDNDDDEKEKEPAALTALPSPTHQAAASTVASLKDDTTSSSTTPNNHNNNHAVNNPTMDDGANHNTNGDYNNSNKQSCTCCAGCGVLESEASCPLLLFEDPEKEEEATEGNKGDDDRKKSEEEEEKRYCASCMVNKKVRVFWPVDSQWYIAIVQRYDTTSGEHLLCYPDGDTEWVRIGEDHTTSTQYREYFRMHNGGGDGASTSAGTTEAGNLTRLPSLNTGMSFALSAMSQSFGMPGVGEDSERLKPGGGGGGGGSSHSHQQQRLFQQLNLDRTASSMSSFGMYGGRQPSFGQPHHHSHPHHHASKDGRAPPFQLLSPNYTHSFSSKIGTVPSLDFGPPPPHPGVERKSGPGGEHPSHHQPHPYYHAGPPREDGRDGAPPPNWHAPPPPHHHHHQYSNEYYDGGRHQMYGYPPPLQQVSSPSSSAADPQDHNNNKSRSSPKSKSSSKSSTKKESAKSRKAIPKAWTKSEDEYLLDQVLQMKHPLKWSVIAQSMSDFNSSREGDIPVRSGKQCRERYVNHLNPRLKHTDFTPLEDSTIWRLYATVGTQWAKMSKVIPGRTDNNLKNRFHNLKRQLQREEDSRIRAPEPERYNELIHVEKVREVPKHLRTRIEDMWNQPRHIGLAAANSVQESRDERESCKDDEMKKDGDDHQRVGGRRFGPFETVTEPIQCGRCNLFMPSVHCGNQVCTKTKWCRTCTKVSINLSGNVLRECLTLRKCQDVQLERDVEMLVAQIQNGV